MILAALLSSSVGVNAFKLPSTSLLSMGRSLDTAATINKLLEGFVLSVNDEAVVVECEDLSLEGLELVVSEISDEDPLDRQLVQLLVTGFKADCDFDEPVNIGFKSVGSNIRFDLDFFSEEFGRVVPVKGQVSESFNCKDDFLDLELSGLGSNIAEGIVPGVACDQLEPSFSNLSALLSDNMIITLAGERPEVNANIPEILPDKEEGLRPLIPSGFTYHDKEKLETILAAFSDGVTNSPFTLLFKSELEKVIEAFKSGDANLLAVALENFVKVVIGIEVPIPFSIVETLIEIDFSSGILEALGDLLGDLDIVALIPVILGLLGVDLDLPTPEEFLAILEELNPILKSILDSTGLTDIILNILGALGRTAELNLNILRNSLVSDVVLKNTSPQFRNYLSNFAVNEKLDVVLNDLAHVPITETLKIFSVFTDEEVKAFFGKDSRKSFSQLATKYSTLALPTTNKEILSSLNFVAEFFNEDSVFSLLEFVTVSNDDLFNITIPLDGFGSLTLFLNDINVDFDLQIDDSNSGNVGESSIALPVFNLNKADFTIQISLSVEQEVDGVLEPFLADTLTLTAGLNGFTQEGLTFVFNYDPLLAYGYDNAIDIASLFTVIGDFAGCTLASSGIALSAQATSLNLVASLDATDALAGFAETLLNTLITFYGVAVPTVLESLLSEFEGTGFLVIDSLSESCTRQGFFPRDPEPEEPVEALFRGLNENAVVSFSVIGLIVMSIAVVAAVFKREAIGNVVTTVHEEEGDVAPPTV